MMKQKIIRLIAVCFLLGGVFFAAVSFASAACRDDCYSSCCDDDPLCRDQDDLTCLTNCLKDCGGDDLPDVPAPKPADE